MLFRGQNILGYRHYADDVVEKFVEKSIKNGIDIIRIFDALNDIRNLECAVKATKKYGGEHMMNRVAEISRMKAQMANAENPRMRVSSMEGATAPGNCTVSWVM